MKVLVVQHKLVTYDYFMNELQPYEMYELLWMIPWSNLNEYRNMRWIVWSNIQPHIKEKKTPIELMPHPTDYVWVDDEEEKLSEEQIEQERQRIKKLYNLD